MSKMKEFRLGVMGAEGRGIIGLLAHQPEKGFRVVAACSLNPKNLGNYREACGNDIILTSDYRDIVADPSIDAVFVCTPDYLHEEYSIAAMEAGKHVFLEKPMAITIEGCDRILKAADDYRAKLYIGHNMRFMPVMQKMHELIVQGAIGQVEAIWCRHFISYGGDAYFKDWHSERRNTTSLLLQKGAHDIDIIQWFAGAYPKSVVGMGKLSVYNRVINRRSPEERGISMFNSDNWPPLAQTGFSPKIDVEDHSMLLMQMENGVQASYMQCHYTPDSCRNYTIIGTEGRIENENDRSFPERLAKVHLWNRRADYGEWKPESFVIPFVQGGHGGADPFNVENFLKMLKGESPGGATPLDARMAVAAGYLGAESLRKGSLPMEIPHFVL